MSRSGEQCLCWYFSREMWIGEMCMNAGTLRRACLSERVQAPLLFLQLLLNARFMSLFSEKHVTSLYPYRPESKY